MHNVLCKDPVIASVRPHQTPYVCLFKRAQTQGLSNSRSLPQGHVSNTREHNRKSWCSWCLLPACCKLKNSGPQAKKLVQAATQSSKAGWFLSTAVSSLWIARVSRCSQLLTLSHSGTADSLRLPKRLPPSGQLYKDRGIRKTPWGKSAILH